MDCCKKVPPNHWNNHNRQIRLNGRCGCACHQGRTVGSTFRPLTREKLLRYSEDLEKRGSLPRDVMRRIIDSHLATV